MTLFKKIKLFFKPTPLPKIIGECLRRGKCCQNIILVDKYDKPIKTKWAFKKLVEQIPLYHIFEPHHKDSIFGYYYFKCSKLGNDNLCTIHDNRPTICAKYPEPEMIRDGGELLPGCGYHAVPKIEFSEILDKELK